MTDSVPKQDAENVDLEAKATIPNSNTALPVDSSEQNQDRQSSQIKSRPISGASKPEEVEVPIEVDTLDVTLDPRNIRRIIAEDPEYNLATVSELEYKSLNKIIENFAFNANMYKQLMPAHKRKLLDQISLDIPLKVVTELIEDGVYWKRKCQHRWTTCDVTHFGGSWKRLFFERNLETIIENFIPEQTDRNCLEDTLLLSAPYVERLIIGQMLPPIKKEPKIVIKSDEGSEGEEEVEDLPKIDHLSFEPIIPKLPHLTELRLEYDVRDCGMNFEWNIFQFTINDCLQLSKCIAAAKQLKVLHINRSRIDCDRCRVLISHLLDHPNLLELNISHNHIGDRGARAVGKLLNNRSMLKVLDLSNNQIKVAGAQAIGFAMTKNITLNSLNLRLNRILDDGGQAICKALLTNETLKEINLAANEMSEPTAAIIAQVVSRNQSLVTINLSNNRLGQDGGKQIQEGMAENRTLLNVDLRFTDCGEEAIFTISQIIYYNQKLKMYENETDKEIKEASPYIISDLRKAILHEHSEESPSHPAFENETPDIPDYVTRTTSITKKTETDNST